MSKSLQKIMSSDLMTIISERDQLREEKAELLETLQDLKEELFRHAEGNYFRPFLNKAEDAIAKAKGEDHETDR